MEHSYVIGDRMTDVQLAANLGCKAIYFALPERGVAELEAEGLSSVCEAVTDAGGKSPRFYVPELVGLLSTGVPPRPIFALR